MRQGGFCIKRLFSFLVVFTIVLVLKPTANAQVEMPSVSAQCACVVERKTGRVICAKNEQQRVSMASTTKIMTALLLCENADLSDTAVVTDAMVRVEGSSMGLQPGDTVHYRDLLYGMMLASGNDAANATALLLDGSLPAFAERMNRRAEQIGMKNTHFVTPSGLDDPEHYSTAADMAMLTVEALKHPAFAEAVASRTETLEYGNPPYKRSLTNHNRLLSALSICDGVKTGFTKKSGRCLVSSAKDGDNGVVVVTLNDPDDWQDHKDLISYGLSQLESRQAPKPLLTPVTVVGGQQTTVDVQAEPISLSLLPGDHADVTVDVELSPALFAPITEGESVGRIVYRLGEQTLATANIYASNTVKSNTTVIRPSFWDWIRRILGSK